MTKIGILGAGQAGQRIATALNNFEDVTIPGIVDPKINDTVIASPDSEWFLPDTSFYEDDDEMLSQNEYDGIIVAADPINMAIGPATGGGGSKRVVLNRNNVTVPILWERPMGFLPSHPLEIANSIPADRHSVMSFARYGLPNRIIKEIVETKSIGTIVDFNIQVTLNCGLANKSWRHLDSGVLLPIHLLDSSFELIEQFGIGNIAEVFAVSTIRMDESIKFDEKWIISVRTDSGVTGRITGIQYIGLSEFLYQNRRLEMIGTEGSLVSAFGATSITNQDGSNRRITLEDFEINERLNPSANTLINFFRSVDKYPVETPCRGEAIAIAECLRTWIDSLDSNDILENELLTTPEQHTRYLEIAQAVIESSESQSWITP